jgi:hypothetical protein
MARMAQIKNISVIRGRNVPLPNRVRLPPNAKLTDDEERAKDNRIGTCG